MLLPTRIQLWTTYILPHLSSIKRRSPHQKAYLTASGLHMTTPSDSSSSLWSPDSVSDADTASKVFNLSPLDEYNAVLLNEVHPKTYSNPDPSDIYDLVVIGAGAGGLVSSRQAARRGGKSAMISANLAGGDCLNVGCVPSKALIRCAKLAKEVRKVTDDPDNEFGISVGDGKNGVTVNFPKVMERMRKLRADIAPVDGHERGASLGVQTFQGFGRFLSSDTVEVVDGSEDVKVLRFKKAVIATGGRAIVPSDIPGLEDAPYTTNESLFNLKKLPPRMVILGAGVIALEMAQTFSSFGCEVTVLSRSDQLFSRADPDAGPLLQKVLEEEDGVTFLMGAKVKEVVTLRHSDDDDLPLLRIVLQEKEGTAPIELECECFLLAVGRIANVDKINLQAGNVDHDLQKGVLIDDNARSISNPNVYAVGDCVAGVPRLTHMSGEMAKVVVQNALFEDDWKISSLVVPACMYTEPEYATVGRVNPVGKNGKEDVDVYMASLKDNDRAILESDNKYGYVKILCKKGTGVIVGCTIIAARAGEMINEVTLAMKHNIGLDGIGRNIHSYPTTGEAIMGCGLQFINSSWKRLDD